MMKKAAIIIVGIIALIAISVSVVFMMTSGMSETATAFFAEVKAKNLLGFANEDFNTLVTKASIASFGMNYQQCHNMVFTSYDFKFEAFYQAVRRCYRFGQKHPVNVHLIIPKSQVNVRKSILEKENKHNKSIVDSVNNILGE